MVKYQEYIELLFNYTILPLEMCEKIVNMMYTYKFKDKKELVLAIKDYPSNKNIYGDCNYWNISNITLMSELFQNTEFNYDISNWDVSEVINMRAMFRSSKFNQDISKWDVSNVENMSCMFERSDFNQNIEEWNVENVEDISCIFHNSKFKRSSNFIFNKWNLNKCRYTYKLF